MNNSKDQLKSKHKKRLICMIYLLFQKRLWIMRNLLHQTE